MLLLVSLFIVHPALAFASSVRESTGIDHAAQRNKWLKGGGGVYYSVYFIILVMILVQI
jgi:hypothetical protein